MTDLDDWLRADGQAHQEHVLAEPDGLVVAGLTSPGRGRAAAVWIDGEPPAFTSGDWGAWSRNIYDARLANGVSVTLEARQMVHARECSSTTCIALWRRLWAFTAARPGIDYLRVHEFTGPIACPGFLIYDREEFEATYPDPEGARLADAWGRLTPAVAMFITPDTGRHGAARGM